MYMHKIYLVKVSDQIINKVFMIITILVNFDFYCTVNEKDLLYKYIYIYILANAIFKIKK